MTASLGLWSEIRHLMMCIHWSMTQTLRDGDERSVLYLQIFIMILLLLQFWRNAITVLAWLFLSLQFRCNNIFVIVAGMIFLSLQFWNEFFRHEHCDIIFVVVSVLIWFYVLTVLMWWLLFLLQFWHDFLLLQFWCGEWDQWSRRPGGDQSVQSTAATEPAPEAGLLSVPPGQRLWPVP